MKSTGTSGLESASVPMDEVDPRARVQVLYRRHRDEVYRLALRYGKGDPAWAEDVTQDVFVSLCRTIHKLDDWDDLGRWFYRVTHNCCLSRLRRNAAMNAPGVRWLLRRERKVDDQRRAEHCTGLREVFETIDVLPPKQRVAFCMYYIDGLEQQEIGDVLGFSKSYVCRLIQKAKAALEEAGWEDRDGG